MPAPDAPVPDVLSFDCPACGKTLKAKPSHAGRTTACPKCGEALTVPAAGASDADETAAAETAEDGFDESATPEPTEQVAAGFPPVIRTGPVVKDAPSNDEGPPIIERASPRSGRGRRRARSTADEGRSKVVPMAIGGGAVAALALGVAAFLFWPGDDAGGAAGENGPAMLAALPPQSVMEGERLEVSVVNTMDFDQRFNPKSPQEWTHKVVLSEAPEGARLSGSGTQFTWTPGEADGPGTASVTVALTHRATGDVTETATFEIAVAENDAPPWVAPLAAVVVGPGESTSLKVSAEDPDQPANALAFRLVGDVPDGVSIADDGTITFAPPANAPEVDAEFGVRVVETKADGGDGASTVAPVRLSVMSAGPGREPATPSVAMLDPQPAAPADAARADAAPADPAASEPEAMAEEPAAMAMAEEPAATEPDPAPADPAPEPAMRVAAKPELDAAEFGPLNDDEAAYEENFVAPLLALYGEPDDRRRPLLASKEYEQVRTLFATEFARMHEREIRQGLGDKSDEILAWLKERPDLRETLFNAFTPADDVAAGMTVFRELYDEFGDRLGKYGALATAAAVVWDDPVRGPYQYDHHAERAKAELPTEERPAAVENVRYFLDREDVMQGRAERLPWELLVMTIDHRTPIEERNFALANYGANRSRFGECYSQVPYDKEMLETESRRGALNGLPYTLPAILAKGGVCAHQADYASRVGKSLGVPAMYVRGDGKFGGAGHAWVMWVDVTGVTDSALKFSLESHGRYQDDHYYVGFLNDPQTGEETTDRDLMRRLHAVATDRDAARHADLLMRAYPIVAKRAGAEGEELSLDARFDYLDSVNQIDPWNAPAWRERAKLAADNAGDLSKDQARRLKLDLKKLFKDFAPFPDFTREVFSGISSYEPDAEKRLALQKQLLDLYAVAGRPDLSFEALPEYVDGLVANEQTGDAVGFIVQAVSKYAEEGRYVPDALDRLTELAKDRPEDLALFYVDFLPLIPPTRGNSPSEYAIAMHKRGIDAAEAANRDDLAKAFTERMRAIGEGKLKSPPKNGRS
ncbi:Ig-like domain-containing protein [Alienimonas chondri]|uniref:Transglutaminase-like domain-containing protein n=1 Tax=Alienimonas chondri TaxID=2681879 RepID=A0ABX1VKC4_9PLAN|nr:Ig-like domain-containing protein [Alienimonas chondri]NNJ27875.1 hypothetical protein [Alienimonas chondri]